MDYTKSMISIKYYSKMKAIDCSICGEDYNTSDMVCLTQCSHFFHYDCIVKWLQSDANMFKSCPNCRKNINIGIKHLGCRGRCKYNYT